MNSKSTGTSMSLFKAGLLFGLCTVLPLRAAPAEANPLLAPRSAANDLQLIVAAPASLNLIRGDNAIDALTNLIASVFEQSGFHGQLTVVPPGEEPEGDVPTLQIYLLDWHIAGGGDVDCTFTAILETQNGGENLGLFTGTSLPVLGRHNSLNRAEVFDEAATEAIDDLYGYLREKNLLPGSIL